MIKKKVEALAISRRHFIGIAGAGAGAAALSAALGGCSDATIEAAEPTVPASPDSNPNSSTTAESADTTTTSSSSTSSTSDPSASSSTVTSPTDSTNPDEASTTTSPDGSELRPPTSPDRMRASRVVVIVVDDLNDYVGFLDGLPGTPALTPNMDAIAAAGVNYRDAHCASPACGSARPAMWWGIDPTITGIYNNSHQEWWKSPALGPGGQSPRARQSILRQLRAGGYSTRGVGKIFHAAKEDKHDPDCWDSYKQFGFDQPNATVDLSVTSLGVHGDFGPQYSDEDFADYKVALAAADEIRSMPEQTALFVGFQKPHLPLVVPQKYFDRYTDRYGTVKPPFVGGEEDIQDLPEVAQSHFLAKRDQIEAAIGNDEYIALVHSYLAAVSFADDMVGIVMDALYETSYAEDTAIILTSDHGFAVGEKLSFSKFQLWEQGTRVPLVVSGPGMTPGTVDSVVSHLDLVPTIAEMAQLPPTPYGEGVSLLDPVREPDRHRNRVVLSSYMAERNGRNIVGVSARDRNHSLIKYFATERDKRELYDRRSDRLELTNLASDTNKVSAIDHLESYMPVQPAEAIAGV